MFFWTQIATFKAKIEVFSNFLWIYYLTTICQVSKSGSSQVQIANNQVRVKLKYQKNNQSRVK